MPNDTYAPRLAPDDHRDIDALCLSPDRPLRDILAVLDATGRGIALVVDGARRLLGTVTDGDIRRWILAGHALDADLAALLAFKPTAPQYHAPVTAAFGTTPEALLRMMQDHGIHQLPLLHDDGRVAGLVVMDDLLPSAVEEPMEAVIMAGGFGKRLAPLTDDLPKPMLPVGGRPLLEHIVGQLQTAGIRRVNVTTHYMPEKIVEHFGNGDRFGVEFNYISEDRPLGTAGAIGLMDAPADRLLVMNGDILTRVDIKSLLKYHRDNAAVLTVGVRKYEFKVPYGVIESDGPYIRKLVEKPSMAFFVNAGIYLLEPEAHGFIPRGERFDMTDLIATLIERGHKVACFPILEYWLDIGQHNDYEKAVHDVTTGRFAA